MTMPFSTKIAVGTAIAVGAVVYAKKQEKVKAQQQGLQVDGPRPQPRQSSGLLRKGLNGLHDLFGSARANSDPSKLGHSKTKSAHKSFLWQSGKDAGRQLAHQFLLNETAGQHSGQRSFLDKVGAAAQGLQQANGATNGARGPGQSTLIAPDQFGRWLGDAVTQIKQNGRLNSGFLLNTASQVLAMKVRHDKGQVDMQFFDPSQPDNVQRVKADSNFNFSGFKLSNVFAKLDKYLNAARPWIEAISHDPQPTAPNAQHNTQPAYGPTQPAGMNYMHAPGATQTLSVAEHANMPFELLGGDSPSGYLEFCQQMKAQGLNGTAALPFLQQTAAAMGTVLQNYSQGRNNSPDHSPAMYDAFMNRLHAFAQSLKMLEVPPQTVRKMLAPIDAYGQDIFAKALQPGDKHPPFLDNYVNALRTAGLGEDDITGMLNKGNRLGYAMTDVNPQPAHMLLDQLSRMQPSPAVLTQMLSAPGASGLPMLHDTAAHSGLNAQIDAFVRHVGQHPALSGEAKHALLASQDGGGFSCLQRMIAWGDPQGMATYQQAARSCPLTLDSQADLLLDPRSANAAGAKSTLLGDIADSAHADHATKTQMFSHYLTGLAHLGLDSNALHALLLTPDGRGLSAAHHIVKFAEPVVTEAFGRLLAQLPPQQAGEVVSGRLANGKDTLDSANEAENPSAKTAHQHLLSLLGPLQVPLRQSAPTEPPVLAVPTQIQAGPVDPDEEDLYNATPLIPATGPYPPPTLTSMAAGALNTEAKPTAADSRGAVVSTESTPDPSGANPAVANAAPFTSSTTPTSPSARAASPELRHPSPQRNQNVGEQMRRMVEAQLSTTTPI